MLRKVWLHFDVVGQVDDCGVGSGRESVGCGVSGGRESVLDGRQVAGTPVLAARRSLASYSVPPLARRTHVAPAPAPTPTPAPAPAWYTHRATQARDPATVSGLRSLSTARFSSGFHLWWIQCI